MSKQKQKITIDGETTFDAWVDPSVRWNGWLCPAFDRDEAEKVAQWSGDDEFTRFRWDGDALFMAESDGAPEWDAEQQVGPDDDGRYPIGAWGWTWSEAG